MRIKRLVGYTLLELLVVITLFIILGAIGIGGYLGTRETMIARETVETIKQDIKSARLKAMLLKKGTESNWVYGIGINFTAYTNPNLNKEMFFKWCSPYEDFGNEVTKAEVLGFDTKNNIGDKIATQTIVDPVPLTLNVVPDSEDGPTEDVNPDIPIDEPDPINNPDPKNPIYDTDPVLDPDDQSNDVVPNDVLGAQSTDYLNAYLPLYVTTSCQSNVTTLTLMSGELSSGILPDEGSVTTLGSAKLLVFEAITGRAFLYDKDGKPLNYDSDGTYTGTSVDSMQVLDIIIKRNYSSKFDLITVYPLSGTIIHNVYNSSNLGACSTSESCITVDGKTYKRYGIADEINSYR